MFIDCGVCAVRGSGCPDCVVTVLLDMERVRDVPLAAGVPGDEDLYAGPQADLPRQFEMDADERRALDLLAQVGLVPGLQHVLPSVQTDHRAVS